MSGGTFKNIADVQVGDELFSYDLINNEIVKSKVTQNFERKRDSYYEINNNLKVTSEHPFAKIVNNEILWTAVEDLNIGDIIKSNNKNIEIKSIKEVSAPDTSVYNMQVDTYMNYFVFDGKELWLVHNKGGGG